MRKFPEQRLFCFCGCSSTRHFCGDFSFCVEFAESAEKALFGRNRFKKEKAFPLSLKITSYKILRRENTILANAN